MVVLGSVLVAVVVFAACGGSSSAASSSGSSSTSSTVAGGATGTGRLSAFRSCMSAQGITLPQRSANATGTPRTTTPGETRPAGGFGGGSARFNTPPPGVNAATYQAALNACRSKLPTGGGGTAFAAYRSCLSDHGVTLPTSGGLSGVNRSDPKVVAATNTCKALLPTGSFRAGSSTPTTTTGGA